MNKIFNLCLIVILMIALIPTAAADETSTTAEPFPTYDKTIDLTPWNPQTDEYMRYWVKGDLQHLDPLGFIYSFVHVFDKFFGEFIIIVFYAIWLFLVWNRSRGAELTVLGMLCTGSLVGVLLPTYSFGYLLLILGMGMASIIFRLMKNKK